MSAHGRRPAFVEQGVYRARSYTYSETLERARACAAWLHGQGLHRERVVLLAKPGWGWAVAFYGCILSGAVVVPIDSGFSADFVARVKEKTGALLTITDETFPTLESLPAAPDFQAAPAARDDLAEIVFTSGTTAEPRGVMITHGNLLANLEPVEQEIQRYLWMARPFSPIRFINLIPLSHLFGQVMGLFIPQLLGGSVIFPESQSPAFLAATIRQRRVSVMVSVPQQLEALGAWGQAALPAAFEPERKTASKDACPTKPTGILSRWWKYRQVHRALGWKMWAFIVGGAPLPPAVGKLWGDMGYAVIQGYGLTETAPAIAITHPFRQGGAGSVGLRLAGVETRVAEDGEILVRGPNVSPGYYGEPAIEGDGWLHTGDLGRFDEQGNLFFLGRKKDVIVTASGLNVYPTDVERALEAQPEIAEAAVVGRESGGRASVHAVIVARGSQPPAEAIARANGTLEPHQRIQGFSLWPEATLPRTVSTKKLQRAAIAAWVNHAGQAGMPAPKEGWRRFFTERGISLDRVTSGARLEEDLGLSSLDRVELLTLLETENPASLGAAGIALQAKLVPSRELAPQSAEPDWPRSGVAEAFRAIFRPLILFPLLRWYVKVEVLGAENLTGIDGPALIVANHTSFMDVPVILRALPRRWRAALAPAMSPDHFAKSWQLNLTRLCFNGFLLTPDVGAVQSALRHAGNLVETGHAILVFPEGRLTPDGAIHPFRPGAAVMAERLGLPVIPIRVDGLYEIWPEHQYKPGKGTVQVSFGRALRRSADESSESFVQRLRDWYC
jgi:long-chain acyl-CoA synthetase